MNKTLLISAAFAGLMAAKTVHAEDKKVEAKAPTAAAEPTGECHGVNSCKHNGECGGKEHQCAGKNSCKGKGWKKMTEAQCKDAKGKFKADAK